MASDLRPEARLVGSSPAMAALRGFIRTASAVRVGVLLTGETGTGKSLAARMIHEGGDRRTGPFLVVNCAGVPEGLFESELFGHERGAFTGAVESRTGLFEAASGGTLFLDEVGELPVGQQSKLLTVLEDREVRRVGGTRPLPVDARVLAGTGAALGVALAEGGFRRDLYHRLAVLHHHIPPLRERPEDAERLAAHLLRRLGRKHGRPGARLAECGRIFVREHGWPGNARELAHALEAAVILGPDRSVTGALLASVTAAPGALPGGTALSGRRLRDPAGRRGG